MLAALVGPFSAAYVLANLCMSFKSALVVLTSSGGPGRPCCLYLPHNASLFNMPPIRLF